MTEKRSTNVQSVGFRIVASNAAKNTKNRAQHSKAQMDQAMIR